MGAAMLPLLLLLRVLQMLGSRALRLSSRAPACPIRAFCALWHFVRVTVLAKVALPVVLAVPSVRDFDAARRRAGTVEGVLLVR